MVDENFSCIKQVTKTVHIPLPPLYIRNEIAGVMDILETWKRQYVQPLQGIVVSYKNVSLTSNPTDPGFIVSDKPCVHYDVKATFDLFCPNIGSIVEGKINRVSHDYVGCLVHDTINVAIKLHNDSPDELVSLLVLDRMILFKITCFDFHRRVIRVKGEITDECLKLMKEIPSFSVASNEVKNSKSTYSSDLSDDNFNCDVPKTTDENNDATYEDSSNQSQSLITPNYSLQASDIFNCDHLADGGGFSTSIDDDSSQSDIVSKENKSVSHDRTFRDKTESMGINIKSEFSQKKKKKHKDQKSKKKSSKKNDSVHSSESPSKKKEIKNELFSDSTLINESIGEVTGKKTTKKKKKSKDELLHSSTLKIPGLNSDTPFTAIIKEEMTTDSGYPSPTSKKKKSKNSKKSLACVTEVKNHDFGKIINSSPSQVIFDSTIIKTEPEESKKRKLESSENEGLPKKKKKNKSVIKSEKSTEKSSKKGKLKNKDKTDKSSKKKKKKKSKDKHLKSKEKLSDKIKTKKSKDKKPKTKKTKKSSEAKT